MGLLTLLVAALLVVLFLGALFHPIIGIIGYLTVYTIFNDNLWWCKPISQILARPSLVASIFLLLGCLLHRDKINWNISKREWLFYLFLVLCWIVTFGSSIGMNHESMNVLEKVTKTFIFLFMMIRVVCTLDRFKITMWAYIAGAVFLAYQAHDIGQHYFYTGRLELIGGIDFREANALGLFMLLGVTLLGLELLKAPVWKKVPIVLALALMVNTFVLTRSRGAFVGLLGAGLVLLFRPPEKYKKQIWLYATLGCIMLIMLMDVSFLTRMETIDDQASMLRSSGMTEAQREQISRVDFWVAGVKMFVDHPLGIGARNFEYFVGNYDSRVEGRDAHNTYLICATEYGLIGISLFAALIISAFRQLKRVRSDAFELQGGDDLSLYAVGLKCILVMYLVGGMMTHSYLYLETTWMLLALPICLENAANAMRGQGTDLNLHDNSDNSSLKAAND